MGAVAGAIIELVATGLQSTSNAHDRVLVNVQGIERAASEASRAGVTATGGAEAAARSAQALDARITRAALTLSRLVARAANLLKRIGDSTGNEGLEVVGGGLADAASNAFTTFQVVGKVNPLLGAVAAAGVGTVTAIYEIQKGLDELEEKQRQTAEEAVRIALTRESQFEASERTQARLANRLYLEEKQREGLEAARLDVALGGGGN